jgi:hypothetical protein
MKNIMKILFALVASVSLISSANAGELTVTGTAKATYNILKGGTLGANKAKAIGIANEIDFGASGELDNGWAWNYQVQFDPGSGNESTVTTTGNGNIDDSRLELTTNIGTFGIYVSEGGLDVDNAASQSVYGRPSDIGLATGMADGPGIDGFNNLQYHLPAGLLPFGTTFKAAYATGQQNAINSANAAGSTTDTFGDSATQYQITMTPIDGLKIGADYYAEHGAGNTTTTVVQQYEAGSAFATYTAGPAKFGISRTLRAPLILSTSATATAISNGSTSGGNADSVRLYTSNKYSAAFNVNDNLSVSYEMEKSNRELIAQATEFDIESSAIQAAYTMGGMTLALSHGKTDNVGYTNNNDTEQTLFAVTMALYSI